MWDGNNYWLSPRKNTSIVKWNGNDHVIEFEIPEEKKVNNIAYAGIVKKIIKLSYLYWLEVVQIRLF